MNRPQNPRSTQRRKPQRNRQPSGDIWRVTPPVLDVEPIAVPDEVGALLRSLGDPPIGNGTLAGHYFNTVIERAAAIAAALALSADHLAAPNDD